MFAATVSNPSLTSIVNTWQPLAAPGLFSLARAPQMVTDASAKAHRGRKATLAFIMPWIMLLLMATIAEVEKLALDLPESQRAILAAHLLGSLPSVLHDEDEGIAEALRRDAELDASPSAGISLVQLDQQIERRRR